MPPTKPPADPTLTDRNLARLRTTLDAIDEPAWCEGTAHAPDLALELGKDKRAATDPALATWLVKHAEPAPFGHRGKTKVDPAIRKTLRVKQRGKAKIHGLALDAILEQVERALGTDRHMAATLLDVLVYPKGAKFVRHKDTPRAADQLGTLIVEVPCAHTGGMLAVGDDCFPWEGKPKKGASAIRWVALFGDVDHEIEPVRSGTRITLAYTLALTATPRQDADQAAKLDALADAIITLVGEGAPTKPPTAWASKRDKKPKPIYIIPCARMIVAPAKGRPTIETLRGQDRAIADTFVRCGIPTRVCELLMPQDDKQEPFPTQFWAAHEITVPLAEFQHASVVTFTDDASADDEDVPDDVVTKLGPHLDDHWIEMDQNGGWIVRKAARAAVAYVGMYSETGYFGNEASDGYIYRCAAIEVDFSQAKKPKKKPPAKKSKKPAPKKK